VTDQQHDRDDESYILMPKKSAATGARGWWDSPAAYATLKRIAQADDRSLQALVEQAMLLASIRRILLLTLVAVPLVLAAIGIMLGIALWGDSSTSTPTYDW